PQPTRYAQSRAGDRDPYDARREGRQLIQGEHAAQRHTVPMNPAKAKPLTDPRPHALESFRTLHRRIDRAHQMTGTQLTAERPRSRSPQGGQWLEIVARHARPTVEDQQRSAGSTPDNAVPGPPAFDLHVSLTRSQA